MEKSLIKIARERRGLSLIAFAKIMGVSPYYLRKIEHGYTSNIPEEVKQIVADFMKIPVGVIFMDKEHNKVYR